MCNKSTVKKRGLRRSLDSLLKDSEKEKMTTQTTLSLSSRHECFAVIRSKGGSGEMHTTRKLIEDLMRENKNVLVCYENEITSDHYYTRYFPQGCNTFLKSTLLLSVCKTGLINCDWKNRDELNVLIDALNESPQKYSVIFVCGTSSGGKFEERLSPIISMCRTIFISVNSNVKNSIEPAVNLNNNRNLDLSKVKISWWFETKISFPRLRKFWNILLGKPAQEQYMMTLVHLHELTKLSTDKLNKKAIPLKNISLI